MSHSSANVYDVAEGVIPAKAHLHLAGIPGTGKTTFSRWLSDEHGFHHFDVDLRAPGFRFRELPSRIPPLMRTHARLVLDWGFGVGPILDESLAIIEQFQQAGMISWWFDGDERVALRNFLASERRRQDGKTEQEWHDQVEWIRRGWNKIAQVFEGRVMNVLSNVNTSKEERAARIFASE